MKNSGEFIKDFMDDLHLDKFAKEVESGIEGIELTNEFIDKKVEEYNNFLNSDIAGIMKEVIQSCDTCQNGSCRVDYTEKIGLDKNGNPQGYKCIGYINHSVKQKKLTYPHK